MKKETELGLFSDFSMSEGGMHSGWGALIGGGVSAAAMLASKGFSRKSSNWSKYSGAVGLGAGAVAGVGMIAFGHKRAGYLALAVSAIMGLTELIKDIWVEPKQLQGLGLYQPEMTGLGAEEISILGNGNGMGEMEYGAAPIEILGESTPTQALGAYQTEITGAHPLDVMGAGYQPFSGSF